MVPVRRAAAHSGQRPRRLDRIPGRQSRNDAVYASPLLPIPRSLARDDKRTADYLRITAAYRVNRHLRLAGELVRNWPAPSLRRVGADTTVVIRFLF